MFTLIFECLSAIFYVAFWVLYVINWKARKRNQKISKLIVAEYSAIFTSALFAVIAGILILK